MALRLVIAMVDLAQRHALTAYEVRPINILGPRGGLTPAWAVWDGHRRLIDTFTSRKAALDVLAALVNEAYA